MGTWIPSYNSNQPRIGLAGEVFPDPNSIASSIYIFGGSDGTNYTSHSEGSPIQSWGASSNTAPLWTPISPMPTARMGHKAIRATLGNGSIPAIFVIGGYNGTFLNTIEVYFPASDAWMTIPSSGTPRAFFAAVFHNGIIYVAGGQNASGPLASVEGFNTQNGQWTTYPSLPTARYGLDGVILESPTPKFYTVGGIGTNGVTSTVEAFDFATQTWATYPSIPAPRAFHSVAFKYDFWGSLALVSGGLNASNMPVDTVYQYQGAPSGPDWNLFSPLSEPLSQHLTLTYASGHSSCIYYNVGRFGGMGLNGPSLETEYLAYAVSGLPVYQFQVEALVEEGQVKLEGEIPGWEMRNKWWFEKSNDNEVFETLGTPESISWGTGEAVVNGADENLVGNEGWYRLAVEMQDGTVEYSNAAHVLFSGEMGMDIGPIPAREHLFVTPMGIEMNEKVGLKISDLQGRVVLEKRRVWTGTTLEMETLTLLPGVYNLTLESNKGRTTKQFLKF